MRRAPLLCVILGSGLSAVGDTVRTPIVMRYSTLPHFAPTSVEGHRGRLLVGTIADAGAVVFDGRPHMYEGLTMRQVALPVYVARRLGARVLIVTNAAGAVARALTPGDLMLIHDHINLMGANPLIGDYNPKLGPRFVVLRDAYDAELRRLAKTAALARGLRIREGVYAAVLGPAYETAAENKMLRTLGADAVGMSTLPEVIAARQLGMRVLAISVIANRAGAPGRNRADAYHDAQGDVLRTVARAAPAVRAIVEAVAAHLARS